MTCFPAEVTPGLHCQKSGLPETSSDRRATQFLQARRLSTCCDGRADRSAAWPLPALLLPCRPRRPQPAFPRRPLPPLRRQQLPCPCPAVGFGRRRRCRRRRRRWHQSRWQPRPLGCRGGRLHGGHRRCRSRRRRCRSPELPSRPPTRSRESQHSTRMAFARWQAQCVTPGERRRTLRQSLDTRCALRVSAQRLIADGQNTEAAFASAASAWRRSCRQIWS